LGERDLDFLRDWTFFSDFFSGTILTTDLKILAAISGSISSSESLFRRRPRDLERDWRRRGDLERLCFGDLERFRRTGAGLGLRSFFT